MGKGRRKGIRGTVWGTVIPARTSTSISHRHLVKDHARAHTQRTHTHTHTHTHTQTRARACTHTSV